jgi:hypothetical protein
MFGKKANPWIKLSRDVEFHDGTIEPRGAVGVKLGVARRLVDGKVVEVPGESEVHLVHMVAGEHAQMRVVDGVEVETIEPHKGGETRRRVLVPDDAIELIVDRNDVPADRLATYAADWQPRARTAMSGTARIIAALKGQ